MKKFALAMCALVAASAVAKPLRHPVYEPDGRDATSDAARGAKNLFLNAKVTASGQFDKFAPAFAVDGKRNSCFDYWGAENLPQSLTVDMGGVKSLSCIKLYPYWEDGRVYGFKVEGSADGKTWKMLDDMTANSICAGAAGFTLTFDPVDLRYVRTTFTSNSTGAKRGAHIVEIEGFSSPVKSESFFMAGDIYTRYSRDTAVDPQVLAPTVKLTGWRGERVSAMIAVDAFPDNEYLTMVTKEGVIKRTLLSAYAYQRKGGKLAISLDEGDELLFVRHTKGGEELVIATECGMATRFCEDTVRPMGRTARGVRGIRLAEDDAVVGVAVVDEEKTLLTVTRNGFGKRVDFADFREMKNRGGRGVTCQKISDKTGRLAGIATIAEDDDVMMITSTGTMIRVPVASVPVYARSASGVIVMRPDEGAEILSFARVEKEEELEAELARAEEKIASLPPVDVAAEQADAERDAAEADAAAEKEDTHLAVEE